MTSVSLPDMAQDPPTLKLGRRVGNECPQLECQSLSQRSRSAGTTFELMPSPRWLLWIILRCSSQHHIAGRCVDGDALADVVREGE
jgi:hypothetical protein